ncbi:hypothetical protein STTU_5069 [Streptomyces sp. Tu6071]|nr:hypothetical protein STTU_5069 [Streptomyces sp. Tu6071]
MLVIHGGGVAGLRRRHRLGAHALPPEWGEWDVRTYGRTDIRAYGHTGVQAYRRTGVPMRTRTDVRDGWCAGAEVRGRAGPFAGAAPRCFPVSPLASALTHSPYMRTGQFCTLGT